MKTKKRLRLERDKAVADLVAMRRDRTLYIRALQERLAPQLKSLPTQPEMEANITGSFQVILHGVDGQTLFWHYVPAGSGLHQELFTAHAITGFSIITPEVVWSREDVQIPLVNAGLEWE
jgi:hypothetical protein